MFTLKPHFAISQEPIAFLPETLKEKRKNEFALNAMWIIRKRKISFLKYGEVLVYFQNNNQSINYDGIINNPLSFAHSKISTLGWNGKRGYVNPELDGQGYTKVPVGLENELDFLKQAHANLPVVPSNYDGWYYWVD
jgi:hypothetical protein